ncbi:universal stress protein [Paeniglutamicibacter sulfureus]|uniref:Nucleotide-binding universal stress UspA family protein n=1 Tax=Paeniglutamicibacter sulfureus TaxID=43666 RepID=A0ABU2BK62_9MICC|nr:universal stress protein [Paeniglutamicibacter sulfureus]MDR7358995.1 nucleotide-binding universal stress UspA family protein [Paeniglutamicibacter sulfureus]
MAIVACYTDTPEGRAAVARAHQESTRLGEELVVVNVDGNGSGDGDETSGLDLAGSGEGTSRVRVVPRSPSIHDAADLVLQTQQDTNATLIVLGLRRRSRVGKLIMGSHAQRILIEADCPVLTLKAV